MRLLAEVPRRRRLPRVLAVAAVVAAMAIPAWSRVLGRVRPEPASPAATRSSAVRPRPAPAAPGPETAEAAAPLAPATATVTRVLQVDAGVFVNAGDLLQASSHPAAVADPCDRTYPE